MLPIPTIQIDLSQPPSTRWRALGNYRNLVSELCSYYAGELLDADDGRELVERYAQEFVPEAYQQEMKGVAQYSNTPYCDVLVANLYYDALKSVFAGALACTAFSVETINGPLHARNLDWHGPGDLLSRATIVVDLMDGISTRARLVTWPGFVGALSGIAPGKFSVSLNAVLSDESPELAPAITFVLRELLERGVSFEEAVNTLESITVASDSILMVVGTNPGERVVIERTPTRSATRYADGPLIATNDYRCLEHVNNSGLLANSACSRFNRALTLSTSISDSDNALKVLADPEIRMSITAQQMTFQPKTGEIHVRY